MFPKARRSRPATRSLSSSSATALLLVVAALIAGCGGSAPKPKHHKRPKPAAAAKPAPAPTGRLSQAEYASIEREYTLLHPLQNAQDLARAAARAKSACTVLDYPNTALVKLVKADCQDAVSFFIALGGIQTAVASCSSAGNRAAATRCLGGRYRQLGLELEKITASGLDLNRELARRRITGLCALSIGLRTRDLKALTSAAAAANSAAGALATGDEKGFTRYSQQLDKAFTQEDPHDALTGIRQACNPSKPSHAAPAPAPAPRRKARPRRHRRHREIVPGSGLNI